MKLTIKNETMVLTALLISLLMAGLIQGCGSDSAQCTAPDASTITISPSSQTIDTGGGGLSQDVLMNWTVSVYFLDGTPMPNACINITGLFAVPNGYGAYQFQYYPSWVIPNVPVDSGFLAQTDDSGEYTFSTLVSAFTGTWKDTIEVRSGTNYGSADIEIQ